MSATHPPIEVVITGLGVVSPIGIGVDAVRTALRAGQSGVRPISLFDASGFPAQIGGEVADFDPKAYVRPRKSLKVMSREIQLGFSAADMAIADAGMAQGAVDPDRFGVVFGAEMIYCDLAELEGAYRRCAAGGAFDQRLWGEAAMNEMFPLWLLRNLPNMVACHVAIAHDARGANNTICHSSVSSFAAIAEAARVIRRGQADVMIAGGVGGRVNPTSMSYRGALDLSRRNDEPEKASRPFDLERDGLVNGEGAAALVLETRQHAEKRGARFLGRLLSCASAHEPLQEDRPLTGSAIRRVVRAALERANLRPDDLGHVNAQGFSTPQDDPYEAQAIRDTLGDVPVTAPSSYFGHLGAGSGAVELAASLAALAEREIPPTLNYENPDPRCPVKVVDRPMRTENQSFMKLSSSRLGQAGALVVAVEPKPN